jgi:hypothetical protein
VTDLLSIASFLAFCALLAICRFPSPFQGIGTVSTYYAPKMFFCGLSGSSSPFQVAEIPQSHTLFLRNVLTISSLAVMLGLPDFMDDFCPAYFILAWLTELQ